MNTLAGLRSRCSSGGWAPSMAAIPRATASAISTLAPVALLGPHSAPLLDLRRAPFRRSSDGRVLASQKPLPPGRVLRSDRYVCCST